MRGLPAVPVRHLSPGSPSSAIPFQVRHVTVAAAPSVLHQRRQTKLAAGHLSGDNEAHLTVPLLFAAVPLSRYSSA